MKRLIGVVLALAFALAIFSGAGSVSVHAAPSRSLTGNTVCDWGLQFNLYCDAIQTWPGSSTNHGNSTTTTLDNPGGSLEYYGKYLFQSNANGYSAQVGILHEPGSGGLCNSTLEFYYEVTNPNGTNAVFKCVAAVPSGDINQDVTLSMSYFVSNGGGIFFTIIGHNGAICNPCSFGDGNLTAAWNNVSLEQFTQVASFTGDYIWGGRWIDNEYFDGSWHYDATVGTGIDLINANGDNQGPPPQMIWHSTPNGSSNNGGTLYSCLYNNNINFCTFGS